VHELFVEGKLSMPRSGAVATNFYAASLLFGEAFIRRALAVAASSPYIPAPPPDLMAVND
jgi:hypothetical protein